MTRLFGRLREQRLALAGVVALLLLSLIAVLAPVLSPYDPEAMNVPMLPPGRQHLLGTNDVGQDIFSELLYGARFSLLIGFLSAFLSTIIGVMLGVISGYCDRLGFTLMRVVDVFLAVPRFPLIILMAAFMRPGLETLILFFVLFGWPRATRLVRSQVLSERNKSYIEAARMLGAGDGRVLWIHLVPSTIPIALACFILGFQHVILAESGLSFLGLGDPTVKSWGTMLYHAFQYPTIFISDLWVRWMLPPGACITFVVLALTLIGYFIEEWADPRLRTSQKVGRVRRRAPRHKERLEEGTCAPALELVESGASESFAAKAKTGWRRSAGLGNLEGKQVLCQDAVPWNDLQSALGLRVTLNGGRR